MSQRNKYEDELRETMKPDVGGVGGGLPIVPNKPTKPSETATGNANIGNVANPHGGNSYTSTTQNTAQGIKAPDPIKSDLYKPSAAYENAMEAINYAKSGNFTSKLDKTINDLYGQITGRDKFSWNYADDPIYAQYAAQYARNGQRAMQDTMGQAAALTGGYGSSYSQAAGQGAYNAYMDKLNDILPQLEQTAYNRWRDEGDDLLKQYQLASDMRNDEYNRWADQRDFDYKTFINDRDYNYRLEQDRYEQFLNDRNFDFAVDQENYKRQMADANYNYNALQDYYDRVAAMNKQDESSISAKPNSNSNSALSGNGVASGTSSGTKTVTTPNLDQIVKIRAEDAVKATTGASGVGQKFYDKAVSELRSAGIDPAGMFTEDMFNSYVSRYPYETQGMTYADYVSAYVSAAKKKAGGK